MDSSNSGSTETAQKSFIRSYQTGNTINVANFDTLISFVSGYGETYNPLRPELKYPALVTLSEEAKTAIATVEGALSIYTHAVTEREAAFTGLNTFVTNIVLQLKSMGMADNVLEDVRFFTRKIKGTRAIPKKTEAELQAMAENSQEVKYNSVSQMGYDSRVSNFSALIAYLTELSGYTPNEEAYTLEGMQAKLQDFRTKNAKVVESFTTLSNARLTRNKKLYHAETGLYKIASSVKNYIRLLYGLDSYEYKQVKNIMFSTYKMR